MQTSFAEKIQHLHDRAVRELVDAHGRRTDEPLILAVRFDIDDPSGDIHLLEVVDDFPGGDDDELFVVEFERSANLVILGKLQLVLGSPAQVRTAVDRNDEIIEKARHGSVVYDDRGTVATELKGALGL